MVVDGIVYITKARLDFKTKRYIFEDAPPSSNDDFDDQWSNDIDENLTIESSMDLYKVLSEDHILRSYGKKIGIKGSISMTADVYWVGKEQEEFDKINSWGELSFIPAAGALRSCNDAKFMHDKLKAGSQEPLLHNYNLSTKELCICALGADLAEYARIPFSSKQIKKVFDQNNWCERFIDN